MNFETSISLSDIIGWIITIIGFIYTNNRITNITKTNQNNNQTGGGDIVGGDKNAK